MPIATDYRSGFFNKDSLHLHYATWGEGSHTLIAFHGFGRNHEDFIAFTRPLGKIFRIVAVDIFFHGQSHIGSRSADGKPITPNEWADLMQEFIAHIGAEKVWLMGYSMGGRLALKTAELLPDRVGGLYLFAPDGLVVSRWYALLTHNMTGRAIFRLAIQHNGLLHTLKRVFLTLGLVTHRTAAFAMSQLRTREMQWRVYYSWTFLRKLEPRFSTFSKRLGPYGVTIDLYFGLYDKIIRRSDARRLERAYPGVQVHHLRAGHTLLTAANGELLRREGLLRLPHAQSDYGK
jgi:pimeloyl-ACP methyl ester carboxylesterase